MAEMLNGLDSSSPCDAAAIACLKQEGYAFVARYYSGSPNSHKNLTAAEAQLISAAGIQLVAVFENNSTSLPYCTVARGQKDATEALGMAAEIGQPHGTAIYFTVDYDASSSDIAGAITQYMHAVKSGIGGKYAIGIYGSGAVCAAMLKAGLAEFAWLSQSMGFNGSATFSNWNIKQGMPLTICGLNADPDDAHGEYGGFATSS
jgi:Rv2525c-like, glycoside hydrolase-like domain